MVIPILGPRPCQLSPPLLVDATGWWNVENYLATPDALENLASPGSHRMLLGSSVGADTADPRIVTQGPGLWLPGSGGNYASTSDSAAVSVRGDLDLIAYVIPDDWTPPVVTSICSKWRISGNQRSWTWRIAVGGAVQLAWSADGSAVTTKTSPPTGFTDGTGSWLRVALDVDNGSSESEVRGYTSSQPFETAEEDLTWVPLGNAQKTAGVTSVFDSTAELEIGIRDVTATPFAGTIKRMIVKDGIDGTVVFDKNFTLEDPADLSFTEESVNAATVTIAQSAAGAKAQIVGRPVAQLDGGDWFGAPDHADLKPGTGSFWAALAFRDWAPPGSSQTLMSKKGDPAASLPGWTIFRGSAGGMNYVISDGTNSVSAGRPPGDPGDGKMHVAVLSYDADANSATAYRDGVPGAPVDTSTLGNIDNTYPLYVGRRGDSGSAETYDDGIFGAAYDVGSALDAEQAKQVTRELFGQVAA